MSSGASSIPGSGTDGVSTNENQTTQGATVTQNTLGKRKTRDPSLPESDGDTSETESSGTGDKMEEDRRGGSSGSQSPDGEPLVPVSNEEFDAVMAYMAALELAVAQGEDPTEVQERFAQEEGSKRAQEPQKNTPEE